MDGTTALLIVTALLVIGGVIVFTVSQFSGDKRKADDNEVRDAQLKEVAEVARQAITESSTLTREAFKLVLPDKPMRDLGWVESAKEGNGQPVQRPAQHAS